MYEQSPDLVVLRSQVAEAKAVRDSSISDQDYDLAQDQVRFLEAMYKILRDSRWFQCCRSSH